MDLQGVLKNTAMTFVSLVVIKQLSNLVPAVKQFI